MTLEGKDLSWFQNQEEYLRKTLLQPRGVTQKYVSVSRGFNRRDFLILFFTHFLHTKGYHLKGLFTVE